MSLRVKKLFEYETKDMSNRKHNIKLLKTNKGIKRLKINSLLHICGQQITLKHKIEE